MVSITSAQKSRLTKWADNLYAMGKVIPNAPFASDLLQLARSIYEEIDIETKKNKETSPQTILAWMNRIKSVSDNQIAPNDIKKSLIEIYYSMADYVQLSDDDKRAKTVNENPSQPFESQIFWESVVLAFTLWYGGQTFSLQQKELEAELGLNTNVQLQQAIGRLENRSILSKTERGLIQIQPDSRQNVDSSMLFLLAVGINVNSRVSTKRGYATIQASFLQFSKANHHPMAYLTEGVRSYVTDYCQRIFGRLFNVMQEKNKLPNYSTLRRFLSRLSIYSDLDFVVSSQEEIRSVVHLLEDLKAIVIVSDPAGQRYILLKGELLNG